MDEQLDTRGRWDPIYELLLTGRWLDRTFPVYIGATRVAYFSELAFLVSR